MGIKKNLKKLLKEPSSMTIDEISGILSYFGYALVNIAGSHFHFKKQGNRPIIIPVHHGKVTKIYLKDIVQQLKIK